MKRTTLILILAAGCLFTAKADDRLLHIEQANGQLLSIDLNDRPRTTYSDGNLIITSDKATVTLPLESVKRYYYETVSKTAIGSVKAMKATLSKDGEAIALNNLKPGTGIVVYNVAGQAVRRINAGSRSNLVVSVADMPAGVYLIKVNDTTYKITKR